MWQTLLHRISPHDAFYVALQGKVSGGADRHRDPCVGCSGTINKRMLLAAEPRNHTLISSHSCIHSFSSFHTPVQSSDLWGQTTALMSQYSPRSTSFTAKAEPSTQRVPSLTGPRRGSFTPAPSTPPLEDRPDHTHRPRDQEMPSAKVPESSDSTLSYSDDQLTDADDDRDSDAGSHSDDADSDVPLQQSRNSGGIHRDKCFGCWEEQKVCVKGTGKGCVNCNSNSRRCNADRQVPGYLEPSVAKVYKRMQAELIRKAGGKWQPAQTDPRSWLTEEKTTAALDELFRKYGVAKPSYVRIERGRLLMSPIAGAPPDRAKKSRPPKRQRCATPGPPPRRATISRASVPPARARAPTPEPPMSFKPPVEKKQALMLSQEDVDAFVNPSQSISLAIEDIEQEERRIEHLQEMIVPALKKKYAVLQALRALKQGAPSGDRWLPLLNYPAIDQFERGTSAAYSSSRNGPMQHRMVDRLSEQGSERNRRDSADSSSLTAFEAEPPWRRVRS
ncbi:hypothetical protein BCV69DRAFT_179697 [Microstroma glucosiphilum]|uniref:Zn(2)-C6 fungal-type domain-containing protein n=1 Tax=Pseudomicrostroma glucosiphilum TaxID=1684307 RepID=A0A316UD31_9BASI|nr:hypothetical protein BCV69DRAFT_179697 [Pseudomicrostroma glucosiphilum]PWN20955.1 hypothetical protein BCV69DRAFT_179697 [Pseudomicrostroma glucosiphilum]